MRDGTDMERVIVTGGAGMVGSALVDRLVAMGERVIVIDDLSRGRREFVHPGAELIVADLASGFPANALAHPAKAIYHMAARATNVADMESSHVSYLINGAIDYHVISTAARFNLPLLYCSTSCIYPIDPNTFESSMVYLSEEDSAGESRDSLYGWLKLAGEVSLINGYRNRAKIIRLFNVYGPREVPSGTARVIPMLIYKCLTGQNPLEVWGNGKQFRSFVFVDDVVEAILAVMERGEFGTPYNVGAPIPTTIEEISGLVVELCGADCAIAFDPTKPQGVFGRAPKIEKIERATGWYPKTSLQEGIGSTVRWCKEWLGRSKPGSEAARL